jgi:hypothetical protein
MTRRGAIIAQQFFDRSEEKYATLADSPEYYTEPAFLGFSFEPVAASKAESSG